jgi:hypothetical protein
MSAPLFAFLFFVGGFVTDFLTNGVFKVGAWAIWGTTYIGIACIIGTQLLASKRETWTRYGVLGFLIGSFGGHWVMADWHSTRVYQLVPDPRNDTPVLTFRSQKWPQMLLVTSPKLTAKIDAIEKGHPVDVAILVTSDYGCVREFIVDQVAGVDIRLDNDATWVWKTDRSSSAPALSGPGLEDQAFPWCPRRS